MKKLFITLALSVFYSLALFIPVSNTYADTEVWEDVSTSTHWVTGESPYVIAGGVHIPSGVTLTVDPGVKIIFRGGVMLVGGSIDARGDAGVSDSITVSTDPSSDTSSNAMFQLTNGNISFASVAFTGNRPLAVAYSSSTISIKNSTIKNVSSTADYIAAYAGSSLEMSDVHVDSIATRIFASIYNLSGLSVSDSTFTHAGSQAVFDIFDGYIPGNENGSKGNTRGMFSRDIFDGGSGRAMETFGGARVSISNSTVKNYQTGGLAFYTNGRGTISRTQFNDNTTDIESYGGSVAVESSNFDHRQENGSIHYSITAYNLAADGTGVSARNNWWGDTTGPLSNTYNQVGKGGATTDMVDVSPWLSSPVDLVPHATGCCSSVLFIPGVEGSRLYQKQNGVEKQLWEPRLNSNTNKLFLNPNGTSKEAGVYTKDVIGKTNIFNGGRFDESVYGEFMDMLNGIVSQGTIQEWKPLPYDWRFDASSTVGGVSGDDIERIVEALASSSKTHKVTIIAHSNGGLVAKALVARLQKEGKTGLVDQLILVAVPEYGTPLTVASLLHGDGQSMGYGFVLNKQTARTLSQYMQTAYALLPSNKFINSAVDPLITFAKNISWPAIKTYDTLRSFLVAGDGSRTASEATSPQYGLESVKNPLNTSWPLILSSSLLDAAKTVHQGLDAWSAPAGVKVTSVIGTNIATVSGISYTLPPCVDRNRLFKNAQNFSGIGSLLFPTCSFNIVNREALISTNGDGTVMAGSIADRNGDVYIVDLKSVNTKVDANYRHGNILNSSTVQTLLQQILRRVASTSTQASLPEFVSSSASGITPGSRIYTYTVHSPVTIVATDAKGRQTGIFSNSSSILVDDDAVQAVMQDIPNSSYLDVGEGKAVVLAEPAKKIEMEGLDVGSFTFTVTESINNVVVASSTYSDIPTIDGEIASFTPASTSSISIDQSGDGTVDILVPPDDVSASAISSSTPTSTKNLRLKRVLDRTAQNIERLDKISSASALSAADKSDYHKKLLSIQASLQKGSYTDADKTVSSMIDSLSSSLKDSIMKKGRSYSRKYLKNDSLIRSHLYLLRNEIRRMQMLTM